MAPAWRGPSADIPRPSDGCASRADDQGVRRLRIHDVQQNVNHFIASDSKNRSSQNLFRFCIDADFDETLCLALFVGPARLDSSDILQRSARRPDLRISASVMPHRPSGGSMYRAYAWIRSETRRWSALKQIVRNDLVVVIGSMRKAAAAVAVPQRPDAGHVRLQLIVHVDVAAVVGGNPGPVQSQVAAYWEYVPRPEERECLTTSGGPSSHVMPTATPPVALRQGYTFRI